MLPDEILESHLRHDRHVSPVFTNCDGGLGLWAALTQVFPSTRHQRCWNHRAMNLADKLPKRLHPEFRARFRALYLAPTRDACEAARDELGLWLHAQGQDLAAETLYRDWDDFITEETGLEDKTYKLLAERDASLGGSAVKRLYPAWGVTLPADVLHVTQYLASHLPPASSLRAFPASVVDHDPAHLARGLGVVDEPRRILRHLPGLWLVEAHSWGMRAGSDGPQPGYLDASIAAQIAARRALELASTSASRIVTASPYSLANLRALSPVPVVDITQVVAAVRPDAT